MSGLKYHTKEVIGGGFFFVILVLKKKKKKKSNTPMERRRRAVKGCVHVRAGDVVGSPQKYILRDAER